MMSISTNLRTHLRGVIGALQFAWIPCVCAAAVALASQQTIGRVIAAAVALATIALGVAMHAGEIFLGRPAARRAAGAPARYSTGEWMARVR